MDGNQRWAKINNKSVQDGYSEGMGKIEDIIKYCINKDIKYLTLYALSAENFQRNSIYFLYKLIKIFYNRLLNKELSNFDANIKIIGEKQNLPEDIKDILNKIETMTNKNNKLRLNLVFNYGTLNEIISVFKKMENQNIEINEDNLKSNLYLSESPDPDLLIRTGGYQRLSNFILLNLSYTELFFIEKLWPELSNNDLDIIISKFENIKRNYGL